MKQCLAMLIVFFLVGCESYVSDGEKEISDEVGMSESVAKPVLTVIEFEDETIIRPSTALSPEEAAEIGAAYILEVLGISIEGKYVQLSYSNPPKSSRSYWNGEVGASVEDIINHQSMFRFVIDAHTGKRIDLMNHAILEPVPQDRETVSPLPDPTLEEIETYRKLAKEFAERHFNTTKLISIEPCEDVPFNPWMGLFNFTAKDETNRVADVTIQQESQQLFFISTLENDFD